MVYIKRFPLPASRETTVEYRGPYLAKHPAAARLA